MDLIVRRIRADDWAPVRDVRLMALADAPSTFGSSYADEVDRGDEFCMDRAERSSAGDEGTTYLAMLDDQLARDGVALDRVAADCVVGLVSAFRPVADVVELVSMWTSPTARRIGAARMLVGAVVDWAAAGPADAVELWVMRGNEPAYRLYSSCGFAETGDHQPLPSDPCKDEIRMRLDLAGF
jgi:ribosomal protein S18 acetylase RimI-like enzyme